MQIFFNFTGNDYFHYMNIKKQPRPETLWISIGLLLVTVPMMLKHYIPIPDFFRGLLAGVGLGMEIVGLIKLKRARKQDAHC